VVTYDPKGGYGHPDHVQTHTVTAAAVAAAGTVAGTADYPGEPWTVPKFYWTVLARSAFKVAYDTLDGDDLRPEWKIPSLEGSCSIPTRTDAAGGRPGRARRRASMPSPKFRRVGPTGRVCALSNMAMPILGHEHYVLAIAPGRSR
jgi:N-acetyl-1-D-myo-inositol-2-amino-2-deoxy-alpha-D-glucopyranoside deacetylase